MIRSRDLAGRTVLGVTALALRTAGYDRRWVDLRQRDQSMLFLVDAESIPER